MNLLFSLGQSCHGKQVRVIKSDTINTNVLPIGATGMIVETLTLEPFTFEVFIKEPPQTLCLPGDCLEFLT